MFIESRETVLMDLSEGQQRRCKQNRLVSTAGERESGNNGENSTVIYTPSCVKYIAEGKLLYNTGIPAYSSVMT